MARPLSTAVLVLGILGAAGCATARLAPARPVIVLRQPPHNRMLVDRETIRLTFADAARIVGQPCTCAAAGFQVARAGLAALSPERPAVRGELRLVAGRDHATSDVVAFLVGADRRVDPDRATYVVDPDLSPRPGPWRYILADPAASRAYITVHPLPWLDFARRYPALAAADHD